MLMGFVTLGFGFTGYLLPWTVISKSSSPPSLLQLGLSIGLLATVVPLTLFFLYRLELAGGSLT
jgi:heme A synthase